MKYLDVVLELSGANMATTIIQKANAKLKFLYRKRRFLKALSNVFDTVSF